MCHHLLIISDTYLRSTVYWRTKEALYPKGHVETVIFNSEATNKTLISAIQNIQHTPSQHLIVWLNFFIRITFSNVRTYSVFDINSFFPTCLYNGWFICRSYDCPLPRLHVSTPTSRMRAQFDELEWNCQR